MRKCSDTDIDPKRFYKHGVSKRLVMCLGHRTLIFCLYLKLVIAIFKNTYFLDS